MGIPDPRSLLAPLARLLPPGGGLIPSLGPSLDERVGGRVVLITGASSGIGAACAQRLAAAGANTLLVARGEEGLRETAQAIARESASAGRGGEVHLYPTDLSDLAAIDALIARVLTEHGTVDVLVNNAGRSIRRSVRKSGERFHDYERTMAVNYFGALRLTLGLLPAMRAQRRGQVVNVSTLGTQATPPRFSAYIASKSALDGFTRVAAAEVIGDGVVLTTVHMPLVRTPMIAPTPMYRRAPALSPQEAAGIVCEAIRTRARRAGPRFGLLAEVTYALAPGAVDRAASVAYRMFPDSRAARGPLETGEEGMFPGGTSLPLSSPVAGEPPA